MKKVLVWWPMLTPDLVDELENNGYQIVAAIQTDCSRVRCFSLQQVFDTDGVRGPCFDDRSAKLFQSSFNKYLRNLSRLHLVKPVAAGLSAEMHTFEAVPYRYDEACNLFFMHYERLKDILKDLAVEAVWFARPPHLGLDNLLFDLCKTIGIQTLVFQQSLFPSRFFFGTSVDSLFEHGADKLFNNDVTLEDVTNPNLFYMRPQSRRNALGRDFYEKFRSRMVRGSLPAAVARKVANMLHDRRYFFCAALAKYFFHYSVPLLLREMANAHSAREYYKVAAEIDALKEKLPDNFVYFALHLQPEATTSEFGGTFQDQANAIDALESVLPDGWKILVKENPKQGYLYRGQKFYERLSANPSVRFVPRDTSSASLVQRARLTATITGTVGYEALVAGKPVIIFGNAWYKSVPGACTFAPNMDLAAISRVRVDALEVRDEFHRIQTRCADGVIYRSYSVLSARSKRDLAARTANSIARIDAALYPRASVAGSSRKYSHDRP